jgi:hypothetical protein
MALYRYVQTTFWTDPFVENLTREEKLLYIYLLTNSRTKQCGVYEISIKAIAFELDYSKNDYDKIKTLIDKLSKADKIKYNETNNEMLIVNWLKHNNFTNPKVETCIKKELKEVKTENFVDYVSKIIENDISIGDIDTSDTDTIDNTMPNDTLSIPNTYPMQYQSQIKRKRKEKEEEKQNKNEIKSKENTSLSVHTDLQSLKDYWNSHSLLAEITSITDKRKIALNSRIKEHGLDAIYKAIDNVGKSKFMRGGNDKNWYASFDWVFAPNNFVKVLEGNYVDKEKDVEDMNARVEKVKRELGL